MDETIKELIKQHYQDYLTNTNESIDIETQFNQFKDKFCNLSDLILFITNIRNDYVQKLNDICEKNRKENTQPRSDLEQS